MSLLRQKHGLIPQVRRELAERRVAQNIAKVLKSVDDKLTLKELVISPDGCLQEATIGKVERRAKIDPDGGVRLTSREFERTFHFRKCLRAY